MVPSLRDIVTLREENGGSLDALAADAELLQILLKKYGNKLHFSSVQNILAKDNPGLVGLMHILNRLGKLQPTALDKLQQLAGGRRGNDTVVVRSSSPKIVENLVDGASVLPQESIGLTVQSESKIYKRSLGRDLEKVLGK